MNPKERIYSVLDGKQPDRIPNLNIVMQYAAKEIGCSYSEFISDYRLLSQGNFVCAEKYGIDALCAISDPMREGTDLGMPVIFPEDGVPYPVGPYVCCSADMNKLHLVKPEDGRRMSDRVNACALLKEKSAGEYPVIGWVEGCFAQFADLRGVNEFLMDLYDQPEFVRELLDFILEQEILFAKAQISAGADIIGVGDAIASVAGPNFYRELAGPYEEKLLRAIKGAGAKTKLHICGNTRPFLQYMPFDVIDIVDLDWMVPLDEADDIFAGRIVINGNYDPVGVVMQGDAALIEESVKSCAASVKHAYISSAGCEIPRDTPESNLLKIKEVLVGM